MITVPAKLLKLGKDVLIPPLIKLIVVCFEDGVFPRIFKKSLVTGGPCEQDDDNQDDVKKRSISVFSTLFKIMEKVINNRPPARFWKIRRSTIYVGDIPIEPRTPRLEKY